MDIFDREQLVDRGPKKSFVVVVVVLVLVLFLVLVVLVGGGTFFENV